MAFELWNEVEVSPGRPSDPDHLAVRAFALIARAEDWSFSFTDRIPRERGLGSSAATIALGLVAGCVAAGREPDVEELLALGTPLESHADNLAAALAGGVCLTWDGKVERIADDVPATPIAVVPEARVSTREAREALPDAVAHADAAYTAGRAALLGAALASGSPTLFTAALDDRLHEPYRAANAPLLAEIRADLPEGALGATLSGSGPTVIVWAAREARAAVAATLGGRYPGAATLALEVSPRGAGVSR